jgi:hypothetical protein
MAQIIIPSAWYAQNSWTGAYTNADEGISAADSSYIAGDAGNPSTNGDLTAQLLLGGGTPATPNAGTETFRVNWARAGGGANCAATAELWEGIPGTGTLIATITYTHTTSDSYRTDATTTIGSITNYANLYFRCYSAKQAGGGNPVLSVDAIEFETPDSGATYEDDVTTILGFSLSETDYRQFTESETLTLGFSLSEEDLQSYIDGEVLTFGFSLSEEDLQAYVDGEVLTFGFSLSEEDLQSYVDGEVLTFGFSLSVEDLQAYVDGEVLTFGFSLSEEDLQAYVDGEVLTFGFVLSETDTVPAFDSDTGMKKSVMKRHTMLKRRQLRFDRLRHARFAERR